MRGLVTAVRWFGQSVSACLGSNVTRCGETIIGLFMAESRVTPRAATADYLHDHFEPTAKAIDGLEAALAGLDLL